MKYIISLFLAFFGCSLSAHAFDVDGYRSGMSRAEVIKWAESRGRDLRFLRDNADAFMVGKFEKYEIDLTGSFCGDALVSVNRSIDFDTDLFPKIQLALAQYGQPRRTETKSSQINGGNLISVSLSFYSGDQRVVFTFGPQIRDSAGGLRANRSADENYAVKNSCFKNF